MIPDCGDTAGYGDRREGNAILKCSRSDNGDPGEHVQRG